MATAKVIDFDAKRIIKVDDVCGEYLSKVIYTTPFKIRVTNITIPGYTPINPPPIGIAIIGLNNYIL